MKALVRNVGVLVLLFVCGIAAELRALACEWREAYADAIREKREGA